jgi:L-asparagine transporter-like permease
MSYHIATISQRQSLRRNRNSVKHKTDTASLGPISNTLIVAFMIAVLGLLYLTQVTKTSSYGYEVNTLETTKQELVKTNQSLKVESARLQALERIKTSSVAKGLEDVQQAEFVNR